MFLSPILYLKNYEKQPKCDIHHSIFLCTYYFQCYCQKERENKVEMLPKKKIRGLGKAQ